MGNFRRNLQRKHTENYNSFTLMEFRVHCKNLFEIQMHERRGVMVLFQNSYYFISEDVSIGLKKLAIWKARDILYIQTKMLKWTGKGTHVWIKTYV